MALPCGRSIVAVVVCALLLVVGNVPVVGIRNDPMTIDHVSLFVQRGGLTGPGRWVGDVHNAHDVSIASAVRRAASSVKPDSGSATSCVDGEESNCCNFPLFADERDGIRSHMVAAAPRGQIVIQQGQPPEEVSCCTPRVLRTRMADGTYVSCFREDRDKPAGVLDGTSSDAEGATEEDREEYEKYHGLLPAAAVSAAFHGSCIIRTHGGWMLRICFGSTISIFDVDLGIFTLLASYSDAVNDRLAADCHADVGAAWSGSECTRPYAFLSAEEVYVARNESGALGNCSSIAKRYRQERVDDESNTPNLDAYHAQAVHDALAAEGVEPGLNVRMSYRCLLTAVNARISLHGTGPCDLHIVVHTAALCSIPGFIDYQLLGTTAQPCLDEPIRRQLPRPVGVTVACYFFHDGDQFAKSAAGESPSDGIVDLAVDAWREASHGARAKRMLQSGRDVSGRSSSVVLSMSPDMLEALVLLDSMSDDTALSGDFVESLKSVLDDAFLSFEGPTIARGDVGAFVRDLLSSALLTLDDQSSPVSGGANQADAGVTRLDMKRSAKDIVGSISSCFLSRFADGDKVVEVCPRRRVSVQKVTADDLATRGVFFEEADGVASDTLRSEIEDSAVSKSKGSVYWGDFMQLDDIRILQVEGSGESLDKIPQQHLIQQIRSVCNRDTSAAACDVISQLQKAAGLSPMDTYDIPMMSELHLGGQMCGRDKSENVHGVNAQAPTLAIRRSVEVIYVCGKKDEIVGVFAPRKCHLVVILSIADICEAAEWHEYVTARSKHAKMVHDAVA